MEKQFNEQEIKEVQDHVSAVTSAIAKVHREFLKVIDPSESPETMAYVRKVSGAFDNVILTIFQQEDNEKYKEMMRQSTEILIQNLIELHNGGAEKH